MKLLLVIDAQNDFVTGALANKAAQEVISKLRAKIDSRISEGWEVMFTQDSHYSETYDVTLEGKYLPIKHCIENTDGWNIVPELKDIADSRWSLLKHRFGDTHLFERIDRILCDEFVFTPVIEEIELVGFCTDICVISNALILKASVQGETTVISCDSSCCAGTTPEAHEAALTIMKSCHIEIK